MYAFVCVACVCVCGCVWECIYVIPTMPSCCCFVTKTSFEIKKLWLWGHNEGQRSHILNSDATSFCDKKQTCEFKSLWLGAAKANIEFKNV